MDMNLFPSDRRDKIVVVAAAVPVEISVPREHADYPNGPARCRKPVEKRLVEVMAKVTYNDPAELETPPAPTTKETVWIEDAVPPKGAAQGNTPWKFVSKPEPVFSGAKASVREAKGLSQHFFTGANPPLAIEKGTKLFAHVYLDTLNPP